MNLHVHESYSNKIETIDSLAYHLYSISKSLYPIVIVLNRPDDVDLS